MKQSNNKSTKRHIINWDILQYAFWEIIEWIGRLRTLYFIGRLLYRLFKSLMKSLASELPTHWLHAHTHIQWVLDDTSFRLPRGDMVGISSWDMMQQPKYNTYATGTINVPINLLRDILAVPENSSTFSAFFREREVVALYRCSFWR